MAVAACTIEQCYVWSSTQDQALPALAQIPAMQRRRLSPLAKIALSVTMDAVNAAKAQQQSIDYMVWASRFGDEEKTLSILKDISLSQTPSPTAFSTSVHNAIAGLYSILCQDTTPSTSLSAGEETFSQAFIEACALLNANIAERVLLIYYDQPLPDIYKDVASAQQPMLALAMLLGNTGGQGMQLSLASTAQVVSSHEAVQFHDYLSNPGLTQWQHGRYVWKKA